MSNAFKHLFKRAEELGYKVELINKDKRVRKISKDGNTRYIYKRALPLNTVTATKLTKYKYLTSKILNDAGFKAPNSIHISSFDDAKTHIENKSLGFPIVLKPNDKSLGTNVYTNIQNMDELQTLSQIVFSSNKSALIEEYYPWEDYRILVLDGEVIAVAKRIPPFIIGDGKSSIKELINMLNANKVGKSVKFGKETLRRLSKTKLTLDSVLGENEKFVLRGNANIQTGGLVEDMTETMPLFYKDIAIRVAKELGLRFTGVDIMAPNLSGDDYVIIEVNGLPSFDIHLIPTIGEVQDPSEAIWKAVFK